MKIGDLVVTKNKKLVGVIGDIYRNNTVSLAVVWNEPPFAQGCKTYTTEIEKVTALPKGTKFTLKSENGVVMQGRYKNYDDKRHALYCDDGKPLLILKCDKLEFDFDEDDVVNHPSHYTQGKIEVIDYIEDKKLGYHLGNVVKYVSRAGHKNNALEDLKKARWYLNREIENMEAKH